MSINVGAILVSSWGYEQTNRTFYEVVGVGKSSVIVRKLAQDRQENPQAMVGTTTPRPGEYTDEPMRRKLHDIGYGPQVAISKYEWAKLWDGKPKDFTSYA